MKATVLVVEDEALIADDIQRTLERLGYDVPEPVATGREAIERARELRPAIVLMDIKIRGPIDGIETAAAIRAELGIPVVYLTSHSDDATLARAKETQPYGYLLKPFNDRELRTAIEVALHKRELESRIEERERWFATTLSSIGDAVIATDRNEIITFMNPVAERLTGWKREDAIGRALGEVFKLVDPAGRPVMSPVQSALRASFAVELPSKTSMIRQGEKIVVDDSAAPIIDERGGVLGGVIVFRDVTEKRKVEQRLARAERLASIGTMAAGMAHEINNPLASILLNLGMSGEALEAMRDSLAIVRVEAKFEPAVVQMKQQVAELLETLRETEQAAERVRQIVHDLKKFARADETKRSLVDLPDVLEAAAKMADSALRQPIALRREYGTTPFIEANDAQLVQVFSNLILNAAQAMGSVGGRQEIRVSTSTDANGNAIIEIHDDGPGIPAEVQSRIFDPFFTTKPVGAGTGLGLSICHSVVASHGGEITVDSAPDRGTTFRVVLPAASGERPLATEQPPARKDARRAKVMVIDDELAVARSIERTLHHLHDVVVLTDAREAIARIAAGETYDVIFCDLMMPGVSGIDLHRELLAAEPGQAERLVFMSGGALSQRAERFLAGVANVVLTKPFTMSSIRAIVADFVGS